MKLDYVFKKFNIILGSIVNKIGRVYMNIKGEVKPSLWSLTTLYFNINIATWNDNLCGSQILTRWDHSPSNQMTNFINKVGIVHDKATRSLGPFYNRARGPFTHDIHIMWLVKEP